MPCSYLALGGNQGRVAETFDRALHALSHAQGMAVTRVSRSIETMPVGDDQPRFLNAVVAVDTTLPPADLLTLAQRIETDCGRVRERRWGPRTLDIDLILYDRDAIDTPRLKVPHPACWYRRFVLDPLVEIAPDAFHPVRQLTAAELRNRLLARPLEMSIAGEPRSGRLADLIDKLQSEFPDVLFTNWRHRAEQPAGDAEPTMIAWLGTAAGDAGSFADLPRVSRLDVTASSDPPEVFLRHVLQAALGR